MSKAEGVKITTPLARFSYPHLLEPFQYQGKGEAYYSCVLLFPKSTDLSDMKRKIFQAAQSAFGPKSNWPKNLKLPWRDGNEKSDSIGYEDTYFVYTKNKHKPVVIDNNKKPIDDESKVYGGMYGRAVLIAKATESGGNYFISLYLQGVQKWKDGERFGGGIDIEKDFDDSLMEDGFEEESEEDFSDMGF